MRRRRRKKKRKTKKSNNNNNRYVDDDNKIRTKYKKAIREGTEQAHEIMSITTLYYFDLYNAVH